MTLCRLSKMAAIWRLYRCKSTVSFWFYDVLYSRKQPNFNHISQSTANVLLLPVADNKRPPYLTSTVGFDFDLFCVIRM